MEKSEKILKVIHQKNDIDWTSIILEKQGFYDIREQTIIFWIMTKIYFQKLHLNFTPPKL